jgi:hypothetical protein
LIGGNLSDASSAAAAARKDLNAASLRLRALDPSKPFQAVRAAELAKRDALGASPFHLLAAQLTGKPVTEISESAMSSIMRFFILGASILTAGTASIMAMCAVTPIKAETEDSVTISGEGMVELAAAIAKTGKNFRGPEDFSTESEATPEPAPPVSPAHEPLLLEQPAPARRDGATPAKRRGRQNAALDGRTRQGKAARRKAVSKAAPDENVVKFPANKESSS